MCLCISDFRRDLINTIKVHLIQMHVLIKKSTNTKRIGCNNVSVDVLQIISNSTATYVLLILSVSIVIIQ